VNDASLFLAAELYEPLRAIESFAVRMARTWAGREIAEDDFHRKRPCHQGP
jgi:hypothetical protein